MPQVKILVGKDKDGNPVPVYAPYEEMLAPDVNAARLWLFNRQPDRWRDRKSLEVVSGIEHRISLMSSEERLAGR